MQSAERSGQAVNPSRQMADTEPVANYESKTVMIRAERKDRLQITEICDSSVGQSCIPSQYRVAKRTDTYYGPKLLLESKNQTCPRAWKEAARLLHVTFQLSLGGSLVSGAESVVDASEFLFPSSRSSSSSLALGQLPRFVH